MKKSWTDFFNKLLACAAVLQRDFHYELPPDCIAQAPLPARGASRLLTLEGQMPSPVDRVFADLPQCLRPGDLLVFNNTRVIPARLYAEKETGGAVEILIERTIGRHQVLAQCRASKPLRPGAKLRIAPAFDAVIVTRNDDLFTIEFTQAAEAVLAGAGHMPLPPYIKRADDAADRERYQTVYARNAGAVAAPTAGLHFDATMLDRLAAMGVEFAYLTLHVGAGTFQPVRSDDITQHHMHTERIMIDAGAAAQVNKARREDRRVVAVGTTVVRALESAASEQGEVAPADSETGIFIYPGYKFRLVDALITNFHVPESTLLMLVCAFAGRERVLAAYRHALASGYRFLSYGDVMFLTRLDHADAI